MGTPVAAGSYVATIGVMLGASLPQAVAHTLPDREGRVALDAAADTAERLRHMSRLQTHRVGAGLQQKAAFKLSRARLDALGLPQSAQASELRRGLLRAFPFTARPELRSTGTGRTLTVLVDFKDHRAASELPGVTADRVRQNIYGTGTPEAQAFAPFESVREYYRRASEEKLFIDGEVVGWVGLPKDRSEYEPKYPLGVDEATENQIRNKALFEMISEALDKESENINFPSYDNDHDGDIDMLTVIYAGPHQGWDDFWWAYRWEFFVPEAFAKKFGGKRLKQFVFQYAERRPENGSDFDPTTLIHETGHALGLPDYYDYCSVEQFKGKKCPGWVTDPGPDGGVGGLDIMDGNWGNHNALSRWLLDWIEPVVVGPGAPSTVELAPSGAGPGGTKAAAIFPGLGPTDAPGQELFIVENRVRVGNDGGAAEMPSDGLLIWHVDTTPNDSDDDFRQDNSYTIHKMVRLVRAQGVKDFDSNEWANALDYFGSGKEFTPGTKPGSHGHDGQPTGVSVTNIRGRGDAVAIDIGFVGQEALVASGLAGAGGSGSPGSATLSARLGRAMAAPPIPVVDLARLDQLSEELQSATPEDLARLWAERKADVDPGAPPTEATLLAELLLARWASKDGKAATEALLALPESDFVRGVYPLAMEAWATNNPNEANDWYFAPERAGLRGSGTLEAGERFAETLFRWRGASEPATAAAAVDLLDSAPEIYGAVRGLGDAAAVAGADPKLVDSQLEALNRRSREARALSHAQRALDDVSRQIRDAGGLKQSDMLLRQELRKLGVR